MQEELGFEAVSLHSLDEMGDVERDELPFGVVGFAADTAVQVYNATEAPLSGLDRASVAAYRAQLVPLVRAMKAKADTEQASSPFGVPIADGTWAGSN